ncbi:MAG TPA: hypothetical protein VE088_08020 [Gaiellaceae bacterium]|nr:hypothetical protein [Gaiellaceae bacterium]
MSSDLERRLEGFLREAPEPGPEVGERALARALRALEVPARLPRRRLRAVAILAAAALVLLGLAAGSLAAAGALHVSFGHPRKHTTAPARTLTLPRGADGIAAVVDGRLSVVTRGGFRLQGLPVTAAALSPHALYVAAGIGDSLVAMKPDGRHAWSHAAGGKVVAIAWAPDGLRIAYVVKGESGLVLRTIWGNGTHDSVVDRAVRRVTPSWRADSLAFAYVGAGGRAIVHDVFHQKSMVVPGSSAAVSQVAFAPAGSRLSTGAGGKAVGWLDGAAAVVRGDEIVLTRAPLSVRLQPLRLGGPILSFEASGSTFAAVVGGHDPRIVAGTAKTFSPVLALPRGARVQAVVVS